LVVVVVVVVVSMSSVLEAGGGVAPQPQALEEECDWGVGKPRPPRDP
jgi:hypothetical protein